MMGGMDPERRVEMDEEGNITEKPIIINDEEVRNNLQELVRFTIDQDAYRLMDLILTMNSTIKHFKSANALFF